MALTQISQLSAGNLRVLSGGLHCSQLAAASTLQGSEVQAFLAPHVIRCERVSAIAHLRATNALARHNSEIRLCPLRSEVQWTRYQRLLTLPPGMLPSRITTFF